MKKKAVPVFLTVKKGDLVLIKDNSPDKYFKAKIISVVGGAKNSKINSLFQVYNVKTGQVFTINSDLVCKVG